jgi:hypothetical protein
MTSVTRFVTGAGEISSAVADVLSKIAQEVPPQQLKPVISDTKDQAVIEALTS